jgi:hypothetical protein
VRSIEPREIDTFLERGWMVIDLPDHDSVLDARATLLAWLRAGPAPGLANLEEYHRVVDDGAHADVHCVSIAAARRRPHDAHLPDPPAT